MKSWGAAMLMAGALFGGGCSFNRSNVAALSQRQDQYYNELHTQLENSRKELKDGLTLQLEVSRARERELLEWQRDVAKVDALLPPGTETRGGQRSLLMEATAADLGSLNQVLALESIDQARLKAILDLYDALIKAVAALQENNRAITQYLKSSDAEFALKSLDVAALSTSISTLRDLRDQLQGAEARATAAKAADVEKLQKNIEQVREALLQGLKAAGHK
jgi:hypothetical protein